MTLGVVIGKFEPLHSGNLTVIKLAAELSSDLGNSSLNQ